MYRICSAGVVACLVLWVKLVWVTTDPGMVDSRFKDFDEVRSYLCVRDVCMYVCMYVCCI